MAASESPGRTVWVVPATGGVVASDGEAEPVGEGAAVREEVGAGSKDGDSDGATVAMGFAGVASGAPQAASATTIASRIGDRPR